ncbi:uncharacterized protein [Antedon mediterranea]|uniref:uncharacterized protein n=1 Tax=Antedon mediterranea TaxID=105859 RepID=UPI003AF97580
MASIDESHVCDLQIKCCFHHENITDKTAFPITEVRFYKVVACTKLWVNLDGTCKDIANKLNDRIGKFNTFTSLCIICKKAQKQIRKNYKTCNQKLRKALTDDAGFLRAAAEMKNDQEMLKDIHGKSCACIEVRYHDSCYREYIKIVHRKKHIHAKSSTKSFFDEHKKGYNVFCETIIKERMKTGQEIIRLSKLQKYLDKYIQEEEHINLGYVRSDLLKAKLEKDFPELVFHLPSRRNEATMVYFADISTGSFAEQFLESEESTDLSSDASVNPDISTTTNKEERYHLQDESRTIHLAGLILKNAIKTSESMDYKWPPRASDINNVVMSDIIPFHLFNILAICTNTVQEHIDPSMASVPEEIRNKLEAICQDIVYLASRGRRQTPKSLALGLTIRHMTGSTHLLDILSKFGHCSSPDTIVSYETSLAMFRLSTANAVPDGFRRGELVTMVWDNIDFNEETTSGQGTT